jgi:hypothetical protein
MTSILNFIARVLHLDGEDRDPGVLLLLEH